MLDDIIRFMFIILLLPILICMWVNAITELHKQWEEWAMNTGTVDALLETVFYMLAILVFSGIVYYLCWLLR